jgi:hypothetical protein
LVAWGSVAQLVERSTENREVTGSTPVGATVPFPGFYWERDFFRAPATAAISAGGYILATSWIARRAVRASGQITIGQLIWKIGDVRDRSWDYLDMSPTGPATSRRTRVLTVSLAVGIPVVVVALLVLAFRGITTPEHFAVLRYDGVACHVSSDGRSVYVQTKLTESDDFPQVDTAQLDGASNAALVQFGWLKPPLGYGSGETRPTQAELTRAFAGSRYPRPLPAKTSNLVMRIVRNPTAQSSVTGVDLLIDNGEPAFYQTLVFHLNVKSGVCTVGKG